MMMISICIDLLLRLFFKKKNQKEILILFELPCRDNYYVQIKNNKWTGEINETVDLVKIEQVTKPETCLRKQESK